MRNRRLYDAYIEGVLDFVNYGVLGTGMPVGDYEAHAATEQGFYDAQGKRMLSRSEFDRETVLRRVEVREASVR